MAKLIYVVEDDENIRVLLSVALKSQGYAAASFANAAAALAAMEQNPPDLVIFDIMLEGELDGISALRLMRQSTALRHVPAMMLTAKDSENDKITGLDAGADDYMTKPFSTLELCARVRALLRRTGEERTMPEKIDAGPLSIDLRIREAVLNGQELALSYKEFDLLCALAANPDRALSREELLQSVWGYDFIGETRTLDMHIGTLRHKLGDSPDAPRFIKTVRGVGYRFIGNDEVSR